MEAKLIRVENMVNVPVHSLTFLDYDEETVLATVQVYDWECASAPTDPTREWYTFTWRSPEFSNSAKVYADAVYVAEYTENQAPAETPAETPSP